MIYLSWIVEKALVSLLGSSHRRVSSLSFSTNVLVWLNWIMEGQQQRLKIKYIKDICVV